MMFLAGLLILKVTASVVLGYRDYFPPSFASDFLRGRESYFAGAYRSAFYAHILSGPVSLLLGLVLISERMRSRFPKWHRRLGKFQIALIVLVLAPSGLWMAPYAETGRIAAIGFASLAVVTACCALFGWRAAVKRRFAEHRRWMCRCFLLLSSAVVLRLIGGLATVTNVGAAWLYPLTAWASWLAPLMLFELSCAVQRTLNRQESRNQRQSSAAMASLPAMEISARR